MRKYIIIAGAGFGGITTALKLVRKLGSYAKEYEILLVDKHHHQLYTPALYEIAAIPREYASDPSIKSAILIPITDIVSGKPVTLICDEIIGLRADTKKLVLKKAGELPYEFLVLALGSETNYFGIPGLKENSFTLKTPDDGLRLRDAIEDGIKKNKALKIVVGGAGSTGIELIAEFVNFVCALKEKFFPASKTCNVEYWLIEASPEILPGFEPWVIKKTRKRLQRLGIQIKTDSLITSVTPHEIIFKNGSREPHDILIWTGGIKGPETIKNFGLPLSPKGSIRIDEYLRAGDQDLNIFAIGDNATFQNPKTGKPLPGNIPVAEGEAGLVARNILLKIKNRPLQKFRPMKKYPFVLAIGKKYAVADLIFLRFSGLLGWLIKQLVELRYLLFILPVGKALTRWIWCIKLYNSNDG